MTKSREELVEVIFEYLYNINEFGLQSNTARFHANKIADRVLEGEPVKYSTNEPCPDYRGRY